MHEDEYVFISKPKDSPKLPLLGPDEDTANRRFRFEALPLGTKPQVRTHGTTAAHAQSHTRAVMRNRALPPPHRANPTSPAHPVS